MKSVTYAIGDIHGRLDLLERLLEQIERDAIRRRATAEIVFTGDYVDRGPASFGVVERLIAGPRRPEDRFICLRGNHDDLFVQAVAGKAGLPQWVAILFRFTVLSYGLGDGEIAAGHAGLRRHADFLAGLPLTFDDGTHLFVHAGIRPGVALADQLDEDLVWIRDEFLLHDGPLPRRVVHGHTIMGDEPVVRPNRISIDTGAYRSGRLTAAVFDGGELSFLQAVGEPDRGAQVREALLEFEVRGRPVPPRLLAAFEDFVAGRIDASDLAAVNRLDDAA